MPAALIVGAHRLRILAGARQRVDQCRFADTGGAEQRHRLAGFAPRLQAMHGRGIAGIQRFDDHAGRKTPRRRHERLRRVDDVRLGDDDHGPRARVMCQCQVPFQARDVEVPVCRGHDEHGIHVCGKPLQFGGLAWGAALEGAGPLQHTRDAPRAVDDHPVADDHAGSGDARRHDRTCWHVITRDFHTPTMHGQDTRWQKRGVAGIQLRCEQGAPAEGRQVRHGHTRIRTGCATLYSGMRPVEDTA